MLFPELRQNVILGAGARWDLTLVKRTVAISRQPWFSGFAPSHLPNLPRAVLVPRSSNWGVSGTVANESALRSVGSILSQVRAPPPAPRPEGGTESLRSPFVYWLHTESNQPCSNKGPTNRPSLTSNHTSISQARRAEGGASTKLQLHGSWQEIAAHLSLFDLARFESILKQDSELGMWLKRDIRNNK
ncbi:hypothetical protein PoB_004858800 [Plakobranchus ocellatus]|uniref:Uncharacterized protein n=1 Tax=Plakobranchus ocellatus TaxID=259542 RepID=A0AAV4BSD7_9GAST|nr:hypothetical protein PoB_004858800 [Plakobranchus ocellatus]